METMDQNKADLLNVGGLPRKHTARGTAYHEVGKGEPLVLLHGVGMRLEAWAPQIEAFSRSHRVIAVDMPGHGESVGLPPGSKLEAFVAWFGGFLDEMAFSEVNVAGHSMGALVAGGPPPPSVSGSRGSPISMASIGAIPRPRRPCWLAQPRYRFQVSTRRARCSVGSAMMLKVESRGNSRGTG